MLAPRDNALQVLAREVARLENDHLAAEPDAKWPLLTLARLKEAQVTREARMVCTNVIAGSLPHSLGKHATPVRIAMQARLGLCGGEDAEHVRQEVRRIYERLMKLDPMRAGYYQDALDGKAFVVVSALGTV